MLQQVELLDVSGGLAVAVEAQPLPEPQQEILQVRLNRAIVSKASAQDRLKHRAPRLYHMQVCTHLASDVSNTTSFSFLAQKPPKVYGVALQTVSSQNLRPLSLVCVRTARLCCTHVMTYA